MRNFAILSCASALALAPVLTGCSNSDAAAAPTGTSHQPAVMNLYADVSGSNGAVGNANLASREADMVASEFAKFQLGDSARTIIVGTRSAEHAAAPPPIITSYTLRMPTAQKQLSDRINGIFATARSTGGDDSTNLLYSLEASKPICTPRSRVVLLSDGDESSDNFSRFDAILTGKPIEFPKPPAKYLRGCSVTFYGFGVSADQGGVPQVMSNDNLRGLKRAWVLYLTQSGVNEADINFVSII